MDSLITILHYVLPALAFICLYLGYKKNHFMFILGAIWLTLTNILLQYQSAGWEILGSYFNFQNALTYSLSLILLLAAIFLLIHHFPLSKKPITKYLFSFLQPVLVLFALIIMINLWINAVFIECNRMKNAPILQVASFKPLSQCQYKYVFYKVGADGQIHYLCPNQYLVIPGMGSINTSPDYIINHLMEKIGKKS